jgi:hypothetical protein
MTDFDSSTFINAFKHVTGQDFDGVFTPLRERDSPRAKCVNVACGEICTLAAYKGVSLPQPLYQRCPNCLSELRLLQSLSIPIPRFFHTGFLSCAQKLKKNKQTRRSNNNTNERATRFNK